jgi:hypothetical protein
MATVKVIKPGGIDYTSFDKGLKIFLAGSIEMGKAIDWQTDVSEKLKSFNSLDGFITIFNPRRDAWDLSWEQSENNTEFRNQVNWELNKLEESDIIFLNFIEDTMSPISLLELGHFASSGKLIVCAPKGFYRRGNVEIVCSRMGIPLFENFEDALSSLSSRIEFLLSTKK